MLFEKVLLRCSLFERRVLFAQSLLLQWFGRQSTRPVTKRAGFFAYLRSYHFQLFGFQRPPLQNEGIK